MRRSFRGGRPPALLLLACALGACAASKAAGPPPSPTRAAPASAAVDPLAALLEALPAGADRCVLARPQRAPDAQRERLARVSQGEPLAWLRELDVQAYASVSRERSEGARAQLTLVRIALPQAQARELIERRAGVFLEWSDAPCADPACGPRARFVAPDLLRIERGVFTQVAGEGAEAACAKLAARSPDALELVVARNRSLGELPLRASTVTRVAERGLHVRRVELMPSMEAAARAARDAAQLAPTYAGGVHAEVADLEVTTDYDVAFEDLALVEQDEARMRAAEVEADARDQLPGPPAGHVPETREDVLVELGFRLERAGKLAGAERDGELAAARALLEQAVARQPDDEGLAALLAELLTSELHEPAVARAVIAPFVRPGPAGKRASLLLRQAAALEGEAPLARELAAQELVPRARAQSVARAILARVQSGASYGDAEQSALAEAAAAAPRPVPAAKP